MVVAVVLLLVMLPLMALGSLLAILVIVVAAMTAGAASHAFIFLACVGLGCGLVVFFNMECASWKLNIEC